MLHGFSLVELLVALVIAMLAIAGVLAACLKARDVRVTLDTNARLQETARYAMAVIEADLRMAGFWGLTNRPELITANALMSFPPRCGGLAWVTDTSRFIDGANNAYLAAPGCAAVSGPAQSGSDVLVVRRASAQRVTPQRPTVTAANRDRVMIVTNHAQGQIFVAQNIGNAIPAGYATSDVAGQPPLADTRTLLVDAYYVSANSSVATGYPALRRKTLMAGPDVGDEEIVAGVEDLQVQIGVDMDGDSSVDSFVNPGSGITGVPVCARVWLRVRARDRDNAYRDGETVSYADRTAPATGDAYRRVLINKTIQLRNARS